MDAINQYTAGNKRKRSPSPDREPEVSTFFLDVVADAEAGESGSSATRRVCTVRLSGAEVGKSLPPILRTSLEPLLSNARERAPRVLLVRAYERDSAAAAFASAVTTASPPAGAVRLAPSSESDVAEWVRFCTYLRCGLAGTSPPKAAALRSGARLVAVAGDRLLLLPPTPHLAAPLSKSLLSAHSSYVATSATESPMQMVLTRRLVYAPPPPPPAPPAGSLSEGEVYASAADVAAASRLTGGMDILTASIVERIVSGNIGFPYKRKSIGEAAVFAWFKALALRHVDARAGTCSLRLEYGAFALHGYYPSAGDDSFDCFVVAPLRADAVAAASASAADDVASLLRLSAPAAAARAHVAPSAVTALAGSGESALLPFDHAWVEADGALVDHFGEPARMAAVWRDEGAPPSALWRTREVAARVVSKAVRKAGAVTDASLRRGLFGAVAGCNIFRAHLAADLFALLGATRVLDPCAGWGDRLIGALAVPAVRRYLGCDPNPALRLPHAHMARELAPLRADAGEGGAYEVLPLPFEDAPLPAQPDFDCVLTSPPYFDLELYEDERRSGVATADGAARVSTGAQGHDSAVDGVAASLQSTVKYPTLASWLASWYCPMLDKAWAALRAGGHMAIYINDHRGSGGTGGEGEILMCLPMLRHAGSSLPDAVWVGALGVQGETGTVRPLWLWRKGAPIVSREGGEPAPLYALLAERMLRRAEQ